MCPSPIAHIHESFSGKQFGGKGQKGNNVLGCLAQLVERRPYKAKVGGSIPSAPTILIINHNRS